nr:MULTISPECIES: helix-turn-helix domain-containing protein [unclassified Xenorhabdus]
MNHNYVQQNDWHQADIIAALRKRGTTLATVSREAGLSSSTLANISTLAERRMGHCRLPWHPSLRNLAEPLF